MSTLLRCLAWSLLFCGISACSERAGETAVDAADPAAVAADEATATTAAASATAEAVDQTTPVPRDELRRAYFGDLHVHTSWSTDAYAGGNRVGPADAYRFARGEAVELPSGVVTQLAAPLDFVALTDHAEGFDAIAACTYADHPQYNSAMCRNMRNPQLTQADYLRTAFARGTARPAQRHPELCVDEQQCLASARSTWQRVQAVANEFDDPGRFTALIGYEFSSLLRDFGMLHRNVIFRGADVIPHAISSLDVNGQADFFAELDSACQAPCQVLTIPHNTNYSWGLTFSRTDEDGSAYAPADLERRARLDRLVEVTQQKGNSECQVGVGAADEDCDFGNMFPACAPGQFGRCARPASFVRNALLDGIALADESGGNPFKLGIIGSTDTHQSDPGYTSAEQPSRSARAQGNADAVTAALVAEHPVVGPLRRVNEGGLAGVWAQSNTRADLFDALQRREAFATSGSRMRLRFFAGALPPQIDTADDAVALGYRHGVPMGGDLIGVTDAAFWVWAAQDPAAATLDRVQVVKGWIEGGKQRQRVWDVACGGGRTADADGRCAVTPASVDVNNCERLDKSGAAELRARFVDPDYRADQHAFYYVRVLENPACRWTTWLANSAGVKPPADVPLTVQHRGWSSPIWVRPE